MVVWVKITQELAKLKYGSYVTNKSTLTSSLTRGTNTGLLGAKVLVFFDPPHPPRPPPYVAFAYLCTRINTLKFVTISQTAVQLGCFSSHFQPYPPSPHLSPDCLSVPPFYCE